MLLCNHSTEAINATLSSAPGSRSFGVGSSKHVSTHASVHAPLVFKSLVLGPQKDHRLDRTGPKKDQTAVVVQALW